MNNIIQTNWWIITGGPCSGKSWLIEELSYRGYTVVLESARILINRELSEGKTLQAIHSDELRFQVEVLKMKQHKENNKDHNELIFWERGKTGDSLVFGGLANVRWQDYESPECTIRETHRYKGVFILDQPPYVADHARIETEEESQYIHEALIKSYTNLGYEIKKVPLLPVFERADYILEHIEKYK